MKELLPELIRLLGLDEDCGEDEILNAVKLLKRDNDMLNAAIDESVDSFNITDENGVFLRVNRTFAENTNLTRDDMEGKKTTALVERGAYGPSAIMLALKEKRRVVVYQQGRYGDAIAFSTPIFDEDGNIKYIVSNARFVKELKMLNEFLLHRNRENETKLEGKESKMIWQSSKMKEILNLIQTIAPTDSSILITGETGTGKSMLAKFIHEKSNREGNFVEINCAAVPENLIESELFGYEGGAFTGAKEQGKKGLIELANKGTLFLDEIGDMPLNLQAKLLQVLQNRAVTRVGGDASINVDIRLVTATNKNLEEMIEEGHFRSELYYRINVVPVRLPSLRERYEDIPAIIDSVLERQNKRYNKETILSTDAKKALMKYSWPGNIRELENIIERLTVVDRKGIIMPEDLPERVETACETSYGIKVGEIIPLKDAIESLENQLINAAYSKYGSSYKVADILGISQTTANRKITKYVKKKDNEQI